MSSGWAVSAALLLDLDRSISIYELSKRVMKTELTGLGLNNRTGRPSKTLRTQLTKNCPHPEWFSVSGNNVTLLRPHEARQSYEVRTATAAIQRLTDNSSLLEQFTATLIANYQAAGEEVGYWGTRFKQAVNRNGGLATARRMLKPRSSGQRKGLDTLLEANRPDLSLEAAILEPQFSSLFTEDELAIARERLGEFGEKAKSYAAKKERLFPDELEPGHKYAEGAKKTVRVNA